MEQNTELWPLIIGGIVTIITSVAGAWFAAYSQRAKSKAEAEEIRNKSKIDADKAAEETNEIIYQRSKGEIKALDDSVNQLRLQLVSAETQRRESIDLWYKEKSELVKAWELERHELAKQLDKATADLAKMSHELAESYTEINELRQTIEVVRQEAKRQVDHLQAEIKQLQEENTRLRNGNKRGKL